MPVYFDTEQPTDLQHIAAAIAPYATQEAAESGFARSPQGRNYLFKQYQDLTGDMTADPIADAFKMKNIARMSSQQAQDEAAVATMQREGIPVTTNMSGFGAREVARSQQFQELQNEGQRYQLAGKGLQVPNTFDATTEGIFHERANRFGVGDLYRKIISNNPNLMSAASAGQDPFYGIGQQNPKIGRDVFNAALLNPDFREAYGREPDKARRLYAALTGRNLEEDVASQRTLIDEQTKQRQKMVEGFEGIEADPVSGKLTRQIKVSDGLGGIRMVKQDLTPYETAVYHATGGTSRVTGVPLPNEGGLPSLQGLTKEEYGQYQQMTQQILAKNPGMSLKDAATLAHRRLYAAQNPSATSGFEGKRAMLRDSLSNMLGTPAYKLTDFMLNQNPELPRPYQ